MKMKKITSLPAASDPVVMVLSLWFRGKHTRYENNKASHSHCNRPSNIYAQQRACTQQVHLATSEPLHAQCSNSGVDKFPARLRDVQLILERRIRVADHIKNGGQVIRDQGIAAPLGEETEQHGNQHPLSHTRAGEEALP